MIIDFHTHIGLSMPWVETDEFCTSGEELIGVMDRFGIDRAFCCANPVVGEYYSIVNDYIAGIMNQYPERISGFCRIDPRLILAPSPELGNPALWADMMKNPDKKMIENSWTMRELHRCLKDLGFSGIKLNPAVEQFAPENPLFDPIYDLAVQLNVPVQIHCDKPGHFTANPHRILKLARRFPKLRICAIHTYTFDAIEILSQAENISLELSEVAKGRFIKEAVKHFGEDKVIFGSDYPFGDTNCILALLNEMDFPERIKNKILYENALNCISG